MEQNCRLCLAKNLANDFEVFSCKLKSDLSVYECYNILTSIILENEQERNNSKICLECLQKLHSIYDYRAQIILNNDSFEEWQSIHVKTEIFELETSEDFNVIKDPLNERISTVKIEEGHLKDSNVTSGESDTWDTSGIEDNSKKLNPISSERAKPLDYSLFGTFLDGHENLPFAKKRIICNICNHECSATSFRGHYKRKHLDGKNFEEALAVKPRRKASPVPEKRKPIPNESGNFDCDFPGCFREFNVLANLERHRRGVHLKIKPFKCPICEVSFMYKSGVKRHHKEVHNKSEVEVKTKDLCITCGKSVHRDSMRKHFEHIHLKIVRFKCDLCVKGFYLKSLIIDHIKRHIGNFNINCTQCDKKFTNASDLKAHINLKHKNRPPVIARCTYPDCKAVFDRVVKLNQHVKFKHLKLRRFPCNHCSQTFFTNHKRKLHYGVHHKNIVL